MHKPPSALQRHPEDHARHAAPPLRPNHKVFKMRGQDIRQVRRCPLRISDLGEMQAIPSMADIGEPSALLLSSELQMLQQNAHRGAYRIRQQRDIIARLQIVGSRDEVAAAEALLRLFEEIQALRVQRIEWLGARMTLQDAPGPRTALERWRVPSAGKAVVASGGPLKSPQRARWMPLRPHAQTPAAQATP